MAGETLFCERAIAMVMDWEDEEAEEEEEDDADDEGTPKEYNADSGRLVLRLCALASADASVRAELAGLFPRNASDASGLRKWVCSDAALQADVAEALSRLPQPLQSLLAHKVRYNALDVRTSGETLAYPTSPHGSDVRKRERVWPLS